MKITWGDEDLEEALSDWEDNNQFEPYSGDRPPKGTYQFQLVRLEQTRSSGGTTGVQHPQLIAHWQLKPNKPNHKGFAGYYMRDYIVVKTDGSTAFRVRPLMDALGITAKQFRTATQANKTDRTTNQGDPIFEIFKIGPVKIPGNLVMCFIKPDKRNNDYEDIKYLAASDADDDEGSTDTSNDDSDDTGDEDKPAPF